MFTMIAIGSLVPTGWGLCENFEISLKQIGDMSSALKLTDTEKEQFDQIMKALRGGDLSPYSLLKVQKLLEGKVDILIEGLLEEKDNISKMIYRETCPDADYNDSPVVRNAFVKRIVGEENYGKLKAAVLAQLSSRNTELKHAAVLFLTQGLYAREEKESLLALLAEEDLLTKFVVAKQLTVLGDNSGKDVLLSVIQSNNEDLAVEALEGQARLKEKGYIASTLSLLEQSRNPIVTARGLDLAERAIDDICDTVESVLKIYDFKNIPEKASLKEQAQMGTFLKVYELAKSMPERFSRRRVLWETSRACVLSSNSTVAATAIRILALKKEEKDVALIGQFLKDGTTGAVRRASLGALRKYPNRLKEKFVGEVAVCLDVKGDDFLQISAILFFYETFGIDFGSPYEANAREKIVSKIKEWLKNRSQ